jgi:hypothetical protein
MNTSIETLPVEIILEILKYLGPRDLYRYASTNKAAVKHAGLVWKKRSISKSVPVDTDWGWYRLYMKEVKNTAYNLISTTYDSFTRFKNKKLFKKYAKTQLHMGVLKMFKHTPCMLQLKNIRYDRLELEQIMLIYIHTLMGDFVEKYFQLVYGTTHQDLFSYGLEDLFL